MTGGEAAVKSLKKENVKHVFGLIGSATMEMFDALYHEKKIKFIGRDIDKYKKEYDLFVEATGNEFIPAFMLLSVNEKNETSDVVLMVPDDDFEDINEAMVKVKQYLK